MNKLIAGTGAVLASGLVVLGLAMAPSAAAQTPAPNSGCGVALLALTQADKAAADAAAADTAAADAKKADDELANATDAVNTARTAAVNGGVASANLTAAFVQQLRTERATLLAKPEPRTDVDTLRLSELNKQIPLIDAFLAAQTRIATATAGAESDADALRREADKTDAAALVDAAGKAGDAADVACGRNPGGVHFDNCDQVRAAGKAPLRSTEPGYRLRLDTDRDGLACETVENTVTPTPAAPRIPTAIDTGFSPDQG